MPRPVHPKLTGIHTSANRRFDWNFDKIPSPQRSGSYPSTTEHVPVLCSWCGAAYWPPAHIIRGCCTPEHEAEEQAFLAQRSEREKLLDELKLQEADNDRLRGLLGKASVS